MTVAMYPASALRRQGDLLFLSGGHQRKNEKRVECHQKLQTSHTKIWSWYCFNDIFNQLREGLESDSIMCALFGVRGSRYDHDEMKGAQTEEAKPNVNPTSPIWESTLILWELWMFIPTFPLL